MAYHIDKQIKNLTYNLSFLICYCFGCCLSLLKISVASLYVGYLYHYQLKKEIGFLKNFI